MPNRIHLSPAWCNEHLAQCWHSRNEQTGVTSHLGDPESIDPAETDALAAEMSKLKELGYSERRAYPGYTMTRYTSQPLTLPLDWQMASDERPEYVDVDQDW